MSRWRLCGREEYDHFYRKYDTDRLPYGLGHIETVRPPPPATVLPTTFPTVLPATFGLGHIATATIASSNGRRRRRGTVQ